MFQMIKFYLLVFLNLNLWLLLVPLVALVDGGVVKAQITEANPNDTNTSIGSDGNFIGISGGTESGVNLFHSFDEFNVQEGQSVFFFLQNNNNIQNILNRVIGGEASLINGEIDIFNANNGVNLYLMNPAGIILGSGANLDVFSSFTATTANGIGFGSDWFNASGTNNYTALNGNPTAFAFTMNQPGGIDIRGDLSVSGGNLNLVAGTVVSSGEISANQVNITTVPGNSLVTLTEPGSPLSLEIQPISASSTQPNNWSLPILSLPELLTAGNGGNANRFIDNGDGTIQLSGSGITVENGDVALENITQGAYGGSIDSVVSGRNINISANRNLIAKGNINDNFSSESSVKLSAQDDITTENINLSSYGGPVELFAQGNITTGNIETFRGSGSSSSPDDNVTIDAGKDITTGFIQAGFDNSNKEGDVTINSREGSINIQGSTEINDNSIFANSIEINTPGTLNVAGFLNTRNDRDEPAGDINIGNQLVPTSISIGRISTRNLGGGNGGKIDIRTTGLFEVTGAFETDADGNPVEPGNSANIVNISSEAVGNGGEINIIADGGITTAAGIASNSRSFGSGGKITLNSNRGLVKIGGSVNSSAVEGNGGEIAITHDGGADNVPFKVGDASENGTAGAIDSGINARITAGYGGIPEEFPVLPNGGDATNTPDSITISSINSPPNLTANQQINLSKTEPTQLTFEELNVLVNDADGDNTSIQIDEVTSGTLKINGVEVTSSATINPGDNLEYTPPANTIGDINGFVISAGDNVSSSIPQTVGGRIENTPPTLESNPEIVITENQPAEFTVEDLKAVVNDADGDDAFIQIDQITRGTLRRNGEVITPGTRLSSGDKLEYTPPENANGNIPAFTISASDGLESSTPQSIGITAVPQEDNPQKPPQTELPFSPPKFPTNSLPKIDIDPVVFNVDSKFSAAYESYFNFSKRERVSLVKAREILLKIEKAAGVKPAIIYASFTPIQLDASSSQNKQILKRNQLDLVIVTANGEPIRKTIHTVDQEKVSSVANKFYDAVLEPNNNNYLVPAQKLYQWIVKPLEQELEAKGINNLLFITDENLRSIPLAALHDGKQFLVEKYSVGLTPSLSLTNTEYKDVRKSQVLAMGVSEFKNDNPLPAVPQEVSIIAKDIWQGRSLLNKDFTLQNLQSLKNKFGIIHLATHGKFNGGPPEESFILLWDNKLNLNQFGDLKFNEPTVELLVLSACETAMGDEQAELGFAGFAVRTGAKTALAGLWQVDDSATLGLMAEFYQQLRKAPIKSEALRQAQIAMLKGEIRVENGQLRTSTRGVPLPPKVIENLSNNKITTLTHPYYWAAFTMIGNPW